MPTDGATGSIPWPPPGSAPAQAVTDAQRQAAALALQIPTLADALVTDAMRAVLATDDELSEQVVELVFGQQRPDLYPRAQDLRGGASALDDECRVLADQLTGGYWGSDAAADDAEWTRRSASLSAKASALSTQARELINDASKTSIVDRFVSGVQSLLEQIAKLLGRTLAAAVDGAAKGLLAGLLASPVLVAALVLGVLWLALGRRRRA